MAFSEAELQHFYNHGWVRLPEAFPRRQMLKAQDSVWELMRERGYDVYRDRPETWTEPLIHLKECIDDDPRFDVCYTERWREAVEDLVGEGRWKHRDDKIGFGWWPVSFVNPEVNEWIVPTNGWHWDGQHFHHHVHAPDQGLLMIVLCSDIESQGGATCVLENSHHLVARYLQEQEPHGVTLQEGGTAVRKLYPEMRKLCGIDPMPEEERNECFMQQGWVDEESGARIKVIEATGRAGDIYFLHPFTFHSRSDKIKGEPRFICNWTAPLKEPMCFDRMDGNYSPLEQATRRAIGLSPV